MHVYFPSKYFQKPPGERDKNIKDKLETVYETERDKNPPLDGFLTNGMEKGGTLGGRCRKCNVLLSKNQHVPGSDRLNKSIDTVNTKASVKFMWDGKRRDIIFSSSFASHETHVLSLTCRRHPSVQERWWWHVRSRLHRSERSRKRVSKSRRLSVSCSIVRWSDTVMILRRSRARTERRARSVDRESVIRVRVHTWSMAKNRSSFLPPGRISGTITERVLADRLYLRRVCASLPITPFEGEWATSPRPAVDYAHGAHYANFEKKSTCQLCAFIQRKISVEMRPITENNVAQGKKNDAIAIKMIS